MRVITVIPIGRGMSKDTLSYFTSERLEEGFLVEVPVRGRTLPAIVLSSVPVRGKKTELRAAAFRLRKLSGVSARRVLLPEFVRAARSVADYSATTTGAVIAAFTHVALLKKPLENLPQGALPPRKAFETFAFQADDDERRSRYRGLVRESFAAHESLLIITPSGHEAETLAEDIGRGTPERVFAIHGELTPAVLRKRAAGAMQLKQPVAIVGTPAALSLPRADVRTIICEREHSFPAIAIARPYADARTAAAHLSRELGARLILADLILSVETMWRMRAGEILELERPQLSFRPRAEVRIIDARTKAGVKRKPFKAIGPELVRVVTEARAGGDRIFVYSARKGLAPQTVCNDCGAIVSCPRCNAPLSLRIPRGRFRLHVCARCGHDEPVRTVCEHCGSWNLVELGIGIDRVREELSAFVPDADLFVLDAERAPTTDKARSIVDAWNAIPGGVLIGTERAVPFVTSADVVAIASLDSLFSIPDIGVSESIFRKLISLGRVATKLFCVQTRHPDREALTLGCTGDAAEFYRREIEMRERFEFPPFSMLIRIGVAGSGTSSDRAWERVRNVATGYRSVELEVVIRKIRGSTFVIRTFLIFLDPKKWPNKAMVTTLRELPPAVSISVNARSVLP